jgi:hypothetical protein
VSIPAWKTAAARTLPVLLYIQVQRTDPGRPGLAPERIFPGGGLVDEMTQYAMTRETLDRWGVPEANRMERDRGHFGVTLRAMRTEEFQEFVRSALASPA